jgi:hypothetical protein
MAGLDRPGSPGPGRPGCCQQRSAVTGSSRQGRYWPGAVALLRVRGPIPTGQDALRPAGRCWTWLLRLARENPAWGQLTKAPVRERPAQLHRAPGGRHNDEVNVIIADQAGLPPARGESGAARPLALNARITSRTVSSSAATSRAIADQPASHMAAWHACAVQPGGGTDHARFTRLNSRLPRSRSSSIPAGASRSPVGAATRRLRRAWTDHRRAFALLAVTSVPRLKFGP